MKNLSMSNKIENSFAFSFMLFALLFSQNSHSSDMPTDADIANEINAAFSECRSLSVANIEKINGLKENDQTHQVNIKYEIISKPLSNNKELWENFKGRKEKIEAEYEDFQIKKKSIAPQEDINEFYEKNSEIINNIRSLEKEKVEIRDKMSRIFLHDCNYKDSHFVLNTLNFLFGNYENYGKEIKASFESNIRMLKTDNGWILMKDHNSSRTSIKELLPLTDDIEHLSWKQNIDDNPEKFVSDCEEVEKNVAIEYEGLSSEEAEKKASTNCESHLNDIKNCLKRKSIQSCYEEFEESSSDL